MKPVIVCMKKEQLKWFLKRSEIAVVQCAYLPSDDFFHEYLRELCSRISIDKNVELNLAVSSSTSLEHNVALGEFQVFLNSQPIGKTEDFQPSMSELLMMSIEGKNIQEEQKQHTKYQILGLLDSALKQHRELHHYRTLGIEPGVSPENLSEAYKKARQAYHQDRIPENKLTPELKDLIHEKNVAINNARDYIQKVENH